MHNLFKGKWCWWHDMHDAMWLLLAMCEHMGERFYSLGFPLTPQQCQCFSGCMAFTQNSDWPADIEVPHPPHRSLLHKMHMYMKCNLEPRLICTMYDELCFDNMYICLCYPEWNVIIPEDDMYGMFIVVNSLRISHERQKIYIHIYIDRHS